MKIAAVVVIFNPDKEFFISNLLKYIDFVDKVLIWKNSEDELLLPSNIIHKVIFCGSGQNEYMAKPLNYAIHWCSQNGYDYLLTMDQDSTWLNCSDFVSEVLAMHESDVVIYAPNVNGQYSTNCKSYIVESVITSGSICNVPIVSLLGGFREDYQIYWVDGEFCFWARKNGYKIKLLSDCNLDQQFGKQTKTLFGFTTSNYSPLVYYFLFRNMLWMRREFHNSPSLKCIIYTFMYNIRGILLGENRKIVKLYFIIKACFIGMFKPLKKRI